MAQLTDKVYIFLYSIAGMYFHAEGVFIEPYFSLYFNLVLMDLLLLSAKAWPIPCLSCISSCFFYFIFMFLLFTVLLILNGKIQLIWFQYTIYVLIIQYNFFSKAQS